MLTKALLRQDPELNSPVVASLKLGTLVTVQELKRVRWHPSVEGSLRLKVVVDAALDAPSCSGWISSLGNTGEHLLDVRDQLEYQKLLDIQAGMACSVPGGSLTSVPLPQEAPELTIMVRLRRRSGRSMGLTVDHSDERTLLIQEISYDGLLADWNATCVAHETIRLGDRIVCVNGAKGDHNLLLEQMGAETLELILQRDRDPTPSAMTLGPAPQGLGYNPEMGPLCGPSCSRSSSSVAHRLPASPEQCARGDWQDGGADCAPGSPAEGATASSVQRKRTDPNGRMWGWEDEERLLEDHQAAFGSAADLRWDVAPSAAAASGGRFGALAIGGAGGAGGDSGGFGPELPDPRRLLGRLAAEQSAAAAPSVARAAGAGGRLDRDNRDREWRPVGVCVEEVPDSKLFGDPSAGDNEDEDDYGCGPCREEGHSLLSSLLACAPRASEVRSKVVAAACSYRSDTTTVPPPLLFTGGGARFAH